MAKIIDDIQHLDIDQIMLLIVGLSVFLPFQILSIILGIFALWNLPLIKQKITKQVGWKWYYSFIVLQIIVSLYYINLNGIGFAFCLLGLGIYIAFYRDSMTPWLFKYLTGFIIGLSLTAALIGLVQYYYICQRLGYEIWQLKVMELPKDRITSVYLNANLYAAMCEFFILLCVYRYICTTVIRHRVYYVFVALINLLMIYLTGCRTALIPFLVVFVIFFAISKKQKLFYITVFCEILVLILILLFPNIVPRINNFSTFNSRLKIWEGAMFLIQSYPLLGMGSQTYGLMYQQFGFHKAPHCHNIYLDLLCSYGIVGTGLLLGYGYELLKEWKNINGRDRRSALYALIITSIVVVAIHGLLDVTIGFPNTLMLFLILINSGCMLTNTNVKSYKV